MRGGFVLRLMPTLKGYNGVTNWGNLKRLNFSVNSGCLWVACTHKFMIQYPQRGDAVIYGCDCILSWNFKHIVNIKTIGELGLLPI